MKRKTHYFTAALCAALVAAHAGCSSSSPTVFERGTPDELTLAEITSLKILEAEVSPTDPSISTQNLAVSNVDVDELAMAHTRFQQTHEGVPVFGGEAIVHLNRDGSLFAITDTLVKNVQLRGSSRPTLSPGAAVEEVLHGYDCVSCLTAEPKVDLWVLRHTDGDHLTYRVRLFREDQTEDTAMPVIFVDAHTGEKVWEYNNLQTVYGAGNTLYSGFVGVDTYSSSGLFYLESLYYEIGTFDARNSLNVAYPFTDVDNLWDSPTQRAAADVHYCAMAFLDFFYSRFDRNGIDGSGGPAYFLAEDGVTGVISSFVHYASNYNNASWTGSYMVYGDGDGINFGPFVSVDICAHEMQHGITMWTANLTYSNESGALNESWSDVFGALVERDVKGESDDTWTIGEEFYTPGITGDALRYMNNPRAATNLGYTANDDPDWYGDRYIGVEDNGGVHTNSGIANHAFYLLAVGGTHRLGTQVTGIGADRAGQIWYKALTSYMTSSTNFAGARTATLNAASALFGANSKEQQAVAQAWTAVGVN